MQAVEKSTLCISCVFVYNTSPIAIRTFFCYSFVYVIHIYSQTKEKKTRSRFFKASSFARWKKCFKTKACEGKKAPYFLTRFVDTHAMLPKKYKLSTSFFKEVRVVRQAPIKAISLPLGRVFFYRSLFLYSRFSFIVSNTLCKNIVARNAYKRLLYSGVQRLGLHIISGFDVVVRVYSNTDDPYFLEEQIIKIKNEMIL